MASVSPDDLAHILTTCIPADRFCDGYLKDAFANGVITRVLNRTETVVVSQPPSLE
jgi:hypothetical protein